MVTVIVALMEVGVNSANFQVVQELVTSIAPDTVGASRLQRPVFATKVGKDEAAICRTVSTIVIPEVSATLP